MKIILFNYRNGCIEVLTFPTEFGLGIDDIENRIINRGYSMSEIEWMLSPEGGTPVFYDSDECPTYTL